MELMENNPVVEYNVITATGNHTFGIVASISGDAQINFNEIYCLGNNVGTMPTGDDLLPLNSIGISTKGRIALNNNYVSSTDMGVKTFETILTVYNNTIVVGGDYAVVLDEKSNATVFFNYLVSEKGLGDYSVVGGNQVTVMGNNPALNNVIMSAQNIEMVYGSNNKYVICLLDTEGNPLANYSLEISIGEASYNVTTDETGYATLSLKSVDAGNYTVVASFAGNGKYAAKSFSSSLTVTPKATKFVAAKTVNVLLTAIKKGYYYEITLKDTSGNVLANKKVSITFNGKTYTKTTNSKGLIKFKLASTTAGNKKLTMKFAGDNNYKATSNTATIKITKEATKLVASAKSFKVNVKTKVVKVTLKDSKNKGVKNAKITVKVKGVTYSAKTNSKGIASVKVTKLTKTGSFTAAVKFAGNNYYKAASKSIKIKVTK
jgi:phosphotransferase system HPr-like phosphotransfer protein